MSSSLVNSLAKVYDPNPLHGQKPGGRKLSLNGSEKPQTASFPPSSPDAALRSVEVRMDSLSSQMERLLCMQQTVLTRLDGLTLDVTGMGRDLASMREEAHGWWTDPEGGELRRAVERVGERVEVQGRRLEGVERLVEGTQQVISFIGEVVKGSRLVELLFRQNRSRGGRKAKDEKDKSKQSQKSQKKRKPVDTADISSLNEPALHKQVEKLNKQNTELYHQNTDVETQKEVDKASVGQKAELILDGGHTPTAQSSSPQDPQDKKDGEEEEEEVFDSSESEEEELKVEDVGPEQGEEVESPEKPAQERLQPSTDGAVRAPHRDPQTPPDSQLLHHQQGPGAGREVVRNEIQVMNQLNHANLIQLYAAFESRHDIILVMEYVEGGELFDRIIDENYNLTELDTVLFIRQICEGLQYMHKMYILHLDLKPENILCVSRATNKIKIIDFGLARRYKPREKLRVNFGTPEFLAPEVINYEFVSFPTDMWSLGVITYMLLSGLSPFLGDDDNETLNNILACQWNFEEEEFSDISDEAKDFITRLLVKSKSWRMSAAESLRHPWLSDRSLHHTLNQKKNKCHSTHAPPPPES
ncbi:myosin light chain kinase family member 4 isoform X4 [Gouania willdenowi]|uniref:myosin light chain kinase family member 4 isoform X4 n=1 Tax=Gouania willdenowi TaxID=441366 RepID=UPI00105679B5|nr:myosin light chain kinase family member 4 isoform X4 [Gouania willdenowi]